MPEMTIGSLAKACGVGVETVRYYQRRDLQRVRRALTELIERCDAGRERHCPIIENLAHGP